ncbi:hypothetical protein [Streptomyces sp. NPDC056543]|uniref:hypothetical protein n=1 Tax=unclassified Streptomyces TaxID=2593676 RepID=UPI0036AFBBD9
MNGIELLLRTLHDGEQALAEEFTATAELHRAEHEIHHVATDLATWSRAHAHQLATTAAERGLDLDGIPDAFFAGLPGTSPNTYPEHHGDPEPPLLLLRDLRDLHLAAACNSLHWEMLARTAQASKNTLLLSLTSRCHPRTLRQMRWTNTMIKNLSAQALMSP